MLKYSYGKEKTNSAEKETRQSNKEILRLFQLDALFQEDRYYSIEELKNRLHVSIATLNRDFSKLRDS